MTFLRKRSRSQCSIFSTDDDSTYSRKYKRDERACSAGESTNTQVTAEDFPIDDSCVLRTSSNHTAAHFQFFYWIAFTRKYAESHITEVEQRTCPLLWCRHVFPDQDAMLQHVVRCERLFEGLYWCYQCQKPERIGKFPVKNCYRGHSKTERMTTVAKRMFSALGSTRGRKGYATSTSVPIPETRNILPEIEEEDDSELCERWVSKLPDTHSSTDEKSASYWGDPPDIPELPNTALCELDAAFVPEMSADWSFSQELPDSRSAETDAAELVPGRQEDISISQNAYYNFSEPWNFLKEHSPSDHESSRSPRSMLPRLDTSVTNNATEPFPVSNFLESTMSWPSDHMGLDILDSTVVSPLSPAGMYDFGSLNTFDISPTDSEESLKSLFTDSGYSSGTINSSCNTSNASGSLPPSRENSKKRVPPKDEKRLPETSSKNFLGNHIMFKSSSPFPQVSTISTNNLVVFGALTEAQSNSYPAPDMPRLRLLSPYWSDAKSLVATFGEVLHQDLQNSRTALRQMAPNDIVKELLSLSVSSVVSIGLEVLAGLLQGRTPAAVVSIFAFTHVAYALAVAVDRDPAKVQTTEWFSDSLALLINLPETQRKVYTQIARVIWQPRTARPESSSWNLPLHSPNRLVVACTHFLDLQESFSYKPDNSQAHLIDFNFPKLSFSQNVRIHVLDELKMHAEIDSFDGEVGTVSRRLNLDLITSIRQLELELICAGKRASQPDAAYNVFCALVMSLCNNVYTSSASRTSHHITSITTTQSLFPFADSSPLIEDPADFEYQPDSGYSTMDFTDGLGEEMQASLEAFAREADAINESLTLDHSFTSSHQQGHLTSFSPFDPPKLFDQTFSSTNSSMLPLPPSIPPAPTNFSRAPSRNTSRSTTPTAASAKYKCHCGYEPNGEERWKASNLARHKRTQHPQDVGRKWRCGWRGCTSEFTRSDNLRSHQRDKGHDNVADLVFEEGPGVKRSIAGESGSGGGRGGDGRSRPPKKRRTSQERGVDFG